MSGARPLSDAQLLRRLDQLETLVRFNIAGSQIAGDMVLATSGEDRQWFLDRAHRGLTTAENLVVEVGRLGEAARIRGIRCISLGRCGCSSCLRLDPTSSDIDCSEGTDCACAACGARAASEAGVECIAGDQCACPRCLEDGQVLCVLGDNLTRLVVAREKLVEGYVAMSATPKTRPYTFVPRADRRFGPKDRGTRRAEALEVFDGFLTGLATSLKGGRPRGRMLDSADVFARVHELIDALGVTKTEAFGLVAEELHQSDSTVRDAYYRARTPNG